MLKRNSIIKFILLAIIAILGVLLCVCPFSVPYSADVYTDISTFGINNSLIEVYLNIVIDIVALIPLQHQTIRTETKIYLISQVVQGTVPNYYYGNGVNVDYIPDND